MIQTIILHTHSMPFSCLFIMSRISLGKLVTYHAFCINKYSITLQATGNNAVYIEKLQLEKTKKFDYSLIRNKVYHTIHNKV